LGLQQQYFICEWQYKGDITAFYATPSDIRLKTNIKNIDNGLAKVLSLNGITYNWNDLAADIGKNTLDAEAGVIAQEVQKVLPEVVVVREDGYLTVRYEKLVPLLIEAIKDLNAQLEEIKKKLP
jgi:Chaperone of endosialidase